MKYLSYLIVLIVMSLIAWSTDNTVSNILKQPESKSIQYYEEKLQSVEVKSTPSMLDELLGS